MKTRHYTFSNILRRVRLLIRTWSRIWTNLVPLLICLRNTAGLHCRYKTFNYRVYFRGKLRHHRQSEVVVFVLVLASFLVAEEPSSTVSSTLWVREESGSIVAWQHLTLLERIIFNCKIKISNASWNLERVLFKWKIIHIHIFFLYGCFWTCKINIDDLGFGPINFFKRIC